MDVFFETQSGSKFSIELGYWDTVLEIKKKIEKYQRIPVPLQTLFFEGKALQDDLDIEKCNILHNSRVLVFVDHYGNHNHNSDQVLQTEQSLVPVRNNDQSPVINGHQDSTVTSQDLQTEQSPPSISPKENVNIQDSSVDVRNKIKKIVVILSVFPYSGESNHTKNIMFVTPRTVQVKNLRSKSIQIQLRGHINRPQDGNYFFVHKGRVLNEDQSFEWNSVAHTDTVEIIQDPWISNKNQVPHQTEKSPPSKSVKGIPKLQDSPVEKRTIVVLVKSPYSSEGKAEKSILVTVNAMDEVTTLRDELEQSQQRGEINLPQDGYYLTHQKKVLNEDQSYEWNGVENMDTIVLVPRLVEKPVKGIVGRNKNVSEMMKVGSEKKNNNDQVPQMKQSPLSNSVKEIPKIQDSPVKKRMVVLVVTPSGEGKAEMSILVSVKAMDKVQKLRDELVQSQQRGEINLPQHGYFLSHRKKLLVEDQSYKWNGVQDRDAIVLIPRLVPP